MEKNKCMCIYRMFEVTDVKLRDGSLLVFQAAERQQNQLFESQHLPRSAEPEPAVAVRQQAAEHQQRAVRPAALHQDSVSALQNHPRHRLHNWHKFTSLINGFAMLVEAAQLLKLDVFPVV